MHSPIHRSSRSFPALLLFLTASVCVTCAPAPAPPAAPGPAGTAEARAAALITKPAVRAPHGMVVSSSGYASDVGRAVLMAGGNAVDAAVATGFSLAVTFPWAGNIGGGGFMVIRFPDGSATSIDFREKAPLRATAEMFLDGNGEYSPRIHHASHKAVGVPGTVAGLAKAHTSYGTLPWARLVAPAAALARDGFVVSARLADEVADALPRFEPYAASMYVFSRDGAPYQAGDTLRQPELARSLERIMRHGRDGFYRGETARWIALEMRRHGGLITLEDLARYEAKEREPVRGTYRGYEIISMPPPSSGGVAMIEMLNILEGYDLKAMGHNSAPYIHLLAEAMRRAFRDRATYLADQDFVDVPVARLTSKGYAAELRRTIDPNHAGASTPTDIALLPEGTETTQFSVVDGNGMAVSVTYTLESGYGSKIVVPGAGFLLNNEMGDFNAKPGLTTATGLIGSEPNLARPEQRMLSSMTPSIVARDGELVAVVGSPGGRTIINTVTQVILNLIEFDMDLRRAVEAPRIHHQWLPDRLRAERRGIDAETQSRLEALGHTVVFVNQQGRAHTIAIDPITGERIGVVDVRTRGRDGLAAGYDEE